VVFGVGIVLGEVDADWVSHLVGLVGGLGDFLHRFVRFLRNYLND
jgi:hypothetical protein